MSDTDKSVIIEKGKVGEHMYCKKCGKEIEKDSFCKYCGQPAHEGIVKDNGISISESLMKIREKVRVFGHEKLVKMVSWFAAVLSVINRFVHNEIEVVYFGLAQDDYFVLAEEHHGFALTIIVIQIILCSLLMLDVWKRKIWVGKGMYVSFVITLLIQVAAMMFRIPAPY